MKLRYVILFFMLMFFSAWYFSGSAGKIDEKIDDSVLVSTNEILQPILKPVFSILIYDRYCDGCYDPMLHELAFIQEPFRLNISGYTSFDINDPGAFLFISFYDIDSVPTILLSEEAYDYPYIHDNWNVFGTFEEPILKFFDPRKTQPQELVAGYVPMNVKDSEIIAFHFVEKNEDPTGAERVLVFRNMSKLNGLTYSYIPDPLLMRFMINTTVPLDISFDNRSAKGMTSSFTAMVPRTFKLTIVPEGGELLIQMVSNKDYLNINYNGTFLIKDIDHKDIVFTSSTYKVDASADTNLYKQANNITILKGEFIKPMGFTVDKDGTLYIGGMESHNILKFSKDLQFMGWIGAKQGEGKTDGWTMVGNATNGTEPGMFDLAHGVILDEKGDMYITDYNNKRLQKFSADGKFIAILGEGMLKGPSSTRLGPDGNLYVADYGGDRLVKFTTDGKYLGWMGVKTDGTATKGWEKEGDSIKSDLFDGFNKVHMVDFDSEGNMYVADTWNHKIQKFSKDGGFIGWLGMKDDGTLTNGWAKDGKAILTNSTGGFDAVTSIYFDGKGHFITTEYGNPRVQLFSIDGKFIGWFGGKEDGTVTKGWETDNVKSRVGTEPGAFDRPYDAKLIGNKLYVADTHNHRIQVITFMD
ncbi:MAG: NHL repeat-containing protein [Candidatus Micrarchaeota archaeon]